MNKQIILSGAYFILTFLVFGLFDMVLYPMILPSSWIIVKHTWISTFQVSGLITIMLTYGDYRERVGIRKEESQED